MSDFSAARDAMENGLNGASQAEDSFSTTQTSSEPVNRGDSSTEAQVQQAITELEKVGKFKFQGQEWTTQDLEKAILRQKDYTQKTQTLSQDRKSLDDERKYYENLTWDLMRVRENPQLINQFIATYPQKFHQYAAEFLRAGNTGQSAQTSTQQTHQPDVELLSRLDKLEKSFNEQEVAKNELEINQTIETLGKKYPNAANFKEMVLGRAYEIHTQGTKLNSDTWEQIFKQVDEQVSNTLKTQYSDYVKKQQAANAKAKDVGPGGGTVGGAPKKFNKLSDVTKFAIDDLTARNR